MRNVNYIKREIPSVPVGPVCKSNRKTLVPSKINDVTSFFDHCAPKGSEEKTKQSHLVVLNKLELNIQRALEMLERMSLMLELDVFPTKSVRSQSNLFASNPVLVTSKRKQHNFCIELKTFGVN